MARAESVHRELEVRRVNELDRSLAHPHPPESGELAELGMAEWLALAADDDADLLDPDGGTPVRWHPGEGWIEVEG